MPDPSFDSSQGLRKDPTGAAPPSTTGQGSAAPPAGQPAGTTTAVVVPDALKQQYPEIIDLILHSQSMNDEERQYWINILPVMTDDQRDNLRSILVSEREQLAAIDAKYQKEIEQLSTQEVVAKMEKDRTGKRSKRQSAEQSHEEQERRTEEEILKAIEGHA